MCTDPDNPHRIMKNNASLALSRAAWRSAGIRRLVYPWTPAGSRERVALADLRTTMADLRVALCIASEHGPLATHPPGETPHSNQNPVTRR